MKPTLWMNQDWFNLLVQLACVPEHPLNMRRTHQRLRSLDLPTRDRAWSILAVGIPDIPTSVHRVLGWCLNHGRSASDDVRPLAGNLLGWLLACPDRRVRDRATKALVVLYDGHPTELAHLLDEFSEVDDGSITERLLAVACGWVLRHRHDARRDLDAWDCLLGAAFDTAFGRSPIEHLLARHYARETVRVAAAVLGAEGRPPSRDVAATEPPHDSPWPLKAPSRRSLERAYGQDGKWNVIREWDDFYRYVIERSTRDFLPEGQARRRAARRRNLERRQVLADSALAVAMAALTPDEALAVEQAVRTARGVDRALAEISPSLGEAWQEASHVTRALDRVSDPVRMDSSLVARFVSARVLELGWTHELFGRVDQALGRARGTDGPVEQIGRSTPGLHSTRHWGVSRTTASSCQSTRGVARSGTRVRGRRELSTSIRYRPAGLAKRDVETTNSSLVATAYPLADRPRGRSRLASRLFRCARRQGVARQDRFERARMGRPRGSFRVGT